MSDSDNSSSYDEQLKKTNRKRKKLNSEDEYVDYDNISSESYSFSDSDLEYNVKKIMPSHVNKNKNKSIENGIHLNSKHNSKQKYNNIHHTSHTAHVTHGNAGASRKRGRGELSTSTAVLIERQNSMDKLTIRPNSATFHEKHLKMHLPQKLILNKPKSIWPSLTSPTQQSPQPSPHVIHNSDLLRTLFSPLASSIIPLHINESHLLSKIPDSLNESLIQWLKFYGPNLTNMITYQSELVNWDAKEVAWRLNKLMKLEIDYVQGITSELPQHLDKSKQNKESNENKSNQESNLTSSSNYSNKSRKTKKKSKTNDEDDISDDDEISSFDSNDTSDDYSSNISEGIEEFTMKDFLNTYETWINITEEKQIPYQGFMYIDEEAMREKDNTKEDPIYNEEIYGSLMLEERERSDWMSILRNNKIYNEGEYEDSWWEDFNFDTKKSIEKEEDEEYIPSDHSPGGDNDNEEL